MLTESQGLLQSTSIWDVRRVAVLLALDITAVIENEVDGAILECRMDSSGHDFARMNHTCKILRRGHRCLHARCGGRKRVGNLLGD